MQSTKRALVVTCAVLTLAGVGVGTAGAATSGAASPTSSFRPAQCNGDYGYDPSNDPVHCHYANPLPDRHWWRHHHHPD